MPEYRRDTGTNPNSGFDEPSTSPSPREMLVSAICGRSYSGFGQMPMIHGDLITAQAISYALAFQGTPIPALRRSPLMATTDVQTPGHYAYPPVVLISTQEAQQSLHRARRFVQKSLRELEDIGVLIEPKLQIFPLKKECERQQRSLTHQYKILQDEFEAHLNYLNQSSLAKEAESLSRLTKLGFLLLPFSTVGSILSIQDASRYWILLPLAAGLLAVLVLIGIKGIGARQLYQRTLSWFRHDLVLALKELTAWRSEKKESQTV
jgi:hypothetical protein